MSQEFVAFKLTTGEEVIARLISFTSENLVIEQPRLVVVRPTGPKQMGIALIPWFASVGDKPFSVYRHTIVSEIDHDSIVEQVAQMYLADTSPIDLSAGKPSTIQGV